MSVEINAYDAGNHPSECSPQRINEAGYSILKLPGERPLAGADAASPGSPHCSRKMALEAMDALGKRYGSLIEVEGPWAIEPKDIWRRLGYGESLASLDGRYTRWLSGELALRSQMSALVPMALDELSRGLSWSGGALALPGRVWRRDLRDRIHIGEPRQMDVWVLKPDWRANREDLLDLVSCLMSAMAPGVPWRRIEADHPYTDGGLEVQALLGSEWIEVLECGLAAEHVLEGSGLAGWGGLALGLGLDRMCMLRKKLGDIRRLDDPDPKALVQCRDLKPWKEWSRQPGCARDISVSVPMDWTAEDVVGRAAEALSRPDWLEAVDVVGSWLPCELPPAAIARLGMGVAQRNWLLRIKLRDWTKTIPKALADEQSRMAWDALHQGASLEYRPGGA